MGPKRSTQVASSTVYGSKKVNTGLQAVRYMGPKRSTQGCKQYGIWVQKGQHRVASSTVYGSKKVNTGLQAVRYMGPKRSTQGCKQYGIWVQKSGIPNEIKNVASLSIFKNQIRNCTFLKCTCRLCLEYIPSLGFV